MGQGEFTFEFTAEIEHPPQGLREEAEARLLEIAGGKSDVVGASVAVDEQARGEAGPRAAAEEARGGQTAAG